MHSITKGNRFRLAFAGWWIVWIIVHAWVVHSYGAGLLQGFTEAILCNILLAAGCLLVANNMKYYLPQRERYWYILIMGLVLSALWLFITKTMLKLLFGADELYLALLNNSSTIRFVIGFLMLGAMAVMSILWYTLQEQQEANKRKEEAEKMTKDAELFKLRQQLQPHFLFNSLNSISALAGSQPEKARHMIHQLSDFLRGTLKRDEQQAMTLKEELRHLALYLDIEKVRFGHRLQTDIRVSAQTESLHIPALLLQPVVENAIKFGLYDTTGDVMITIHAEQREGQLQISISNPFDEETAVSTQGTGFGLASIQRRLFLLFARHDLLHTGRQQGIFTTTLVIPQYQYEGNHH
ncbi:sensor histidine kinase [Sediminibacterium sp. WSJ-3]|nr:sensor histidine kinase [Sediminibacterium soli]